MYLKQLQVQQFRNYRESRVEFVAPKTILVGNNAQGKTNLLEAVALLSTLKSQRARRDRELVREGESIGQISGRLERQTGWVDLAIKLRRSGRRTVAVNRQTCRRQLDFLGILNVVQFSSLDLDLVRGGPEYRRGWLDGLVVQLEPVYAHILQQYIRVLRQRNALLKKVRDAPTDLPVSTLAVLDAQLSASGARVMRRRSRAIERLAPLAKSWHEAISGRTEGLQVRYAPKVGAVRDLAIRAEPERVKQAFLEQIHHSGVAERYQGTTLVGPHRDEVEFAIDETPARQYGSQGQQRTLVLALKLAELELIEQVVGEPPVLLLDDVLAELDPNRQNQLLEAIADRFQTLITTTHLGAFDSQWLHSSQILTVEAGKIYTRSPNGVG